MRFKSNVMISDDANLSSIYQAITTTAFVVIITPSCLTRQLSSAVSDDPTSCPINLFTHIGLLVIIYT